MARALLEFLYTGDLRRPLEPDSPLPYDLRAAAASYGVPRLEALCAEVISLGTDPYEAEGQGWGQVSGYVYACGRGGLGACAGVGVGLCDGDSCKYQRTMTALCTTTEASSLLWCRGEMLRTKNICLVVRERLEQNGKRWSCVV